MLLPIPPSSPATIRVLGQSNIPFVMCSSGTMGNNGALSAITALPTTYPSAYTYFPVNQIAAGVAAGWYYTVYSSTTAGTVYNNTYTSGTPVIPSSPTPFVTTGPGAFTQTTGADIQAFAVASLTLGLNDYIQTSSVFSVSNSANNKITRTRFGSQVLSTGNMLNILSSKIEGITANRGTTSVQFNSRLDSTNSSNNNWTTYDTTTAQTYNITVNMATATDYIVIETIRFMYNRGV